MVIWVHSAGAEGRGQRVGAEREILRLKHDLQLKDEELRTRTEGRQGQAGGRRACMGLDDAEGTE